MLFKKLRISNWRQFREVNIEFHESLTVLTGANGAGKTTVLNLLSRHFGWQGNLISTPNRRQSSRPFSSGYWNDDYLRAYEDWLEESTSSREGEPPNPPEPIGSEQEIGELNYGSGSPALLTVPSTVGASFQINIRNQQQQKGMHIPSHRPIFSYQSVENIPTAPRRRDQAFNAYMEIVRSRYYGGHHARTPNYYMKETLIALAAFGYGN